MLDALDSIESEASAFLSELEALPGSYDGPDGARREPYGLVAYGEAAGLPPLLSGWIDAPLVPNGTQFLIASGFDFGELGPLRISSEMAGAEVITLGFEAFEPNLHVPRSPLSIYTYACYLGYATGHGEAVRQAEEAMRALAGRMRAAAPTEMNPAKSLAWALWNRVPLFVAPRAFPGLPQLAQRVFARVGKSLAVAFGEHPLELATGALEGNHAFGDDLVALVLGHDDPELELVREVLGTRVAQIERLDLGELLGEPPQDRVAQALCLWYASLWVAAYVALLHEHDPSESDVYLAVSRAAEPDAATGEDGHWQGEPGEA